MKPKPRRASPVDVTFVELRGRDAALISFDVEKVIRALPELTRAEREVIAAMLAGQSTREIADVRGRSERTIANQLASIYRKLGVSSRHEAAALLAGCDTDDLPRKMTMTR